MTPPARYQPQLDTLWRLLTAKAISSKPLTSIEMLNKMLNAAYPLRGKNIKLNATTTYKIPRISEIHQFFLLLALVHQKLSSCDS